MRSDILLLPALLLLVACGSMQETSQVRDDVYDIPDFGTAMASLNSVPAEAPAQPENDDYYDPGQAKQYSPGYNDYAYSDPQWYNETRFGFGYSNWGSNNCNCYNSPTGMYDPYWNNSWTSGYGYYSNPCYNNYGYYNPWNSGYGYPGYYYDPFAYGSPYYGGGYYGGGGTWYTPPIVSHRPSMSGGGSASSGGGGEGGTPRMSRPGNVSLLQPGALVKHEKVDGTRSGRVIRSEREAMGGNGGTFERQGDRNQRTERGKRTGSGDRLDRSGQQRERSTIDNPGYERGSGNDSGGRSGGGDGGGSSPTTSPRPRR